MASIRKKKNSYEIRVSCGYDVNGKQKFQQMTWRPEEGMTPKQIEKEVNRQAVLFEEKCLKGQVTANVKFEEFAEQWFEEYAKLNLRSTSYERMRKLTPRVYSAIGHLRLDKITGRHVQQFINDLLMNGKSMKTGKPLSRKTAVHHLSFISDVLSYVVKMDVLNDTPCRKVTISKGEKKEKTSSADLGHTNSGTTLGIYTHEFQEAQARTSDIIANALNFTKKREQAIASVEQSTASP